MHLSNTSPDFSNTWSLLRPRVRASLHLEIYITSKRRNMEVAHSRRIGFESRTLDRRGEYVKWSQLFFQVTVPDRLVDKARGSADRCKCLPNWASKPSNSRSCKCLLMRDWRLSLCDTLTEKIPTSRFKSHSQAKAVASNWLRGKQCNKKFWSPVPNFGQCLWHLPENGHANLPIFPQARQRLQGKTTRVLFICLLAQWSGQLAGSSRRELKYLNWHLIIQTEPAELPRAPAVQSLTSFGALSPSEFLQSCPSLSRLQSPVKSGI